MICTSVAVDNESTEIVSFSVILVFQSCIQCYHIDFLYTLLSVVIVISLTVDCLVNVWYALMIVLYSV